MQKFDPNFTDLHKIEIEKPDFESIKEAYIKVIEGLENAKTKEETFSLVRESFFLSDNLQTHYGLVMFHHDIDTTDKKYSEYNEIFDEIMPLIEEYSSKVDKLILESKFIKDIEKEFSSHFIEKLKLGQKTFSPEIIEDLQLENKLNTKYVNLKASGTVTYKGETYSITQFTKFTLSPDRKVREEASNLVNNWFLEHDAEFGAIYQDMIKVRNRIARKLGYQNFIQLGYDRLGRLSYSQVDVNSYRAKIVENIVPLATKVLTDQGERLNLEGGMKYYDYPIFYKSGNPVPSGNKDYLVNAAKECYSRLNKVFSENFNFLVDHNCLDLEAKQGKSGGGYEEFLPQIKSPLIFSNFNYTFNDVDVLTHEFGHALQALLTKDEEVPSLRSPGYEVCEMHSMSMEFFAHKFIDLFFGKDAEKYKYQHICSALTFIPYGAEVDHFQHIAYANEGLTHEELKKEWLKLDKIYRPFYDFEGCEFLASGGWWMKQSHIFTSPFYYIDYTIAQAVSLYFLTAMTDEIASGHELFEDTIAKYLNLCHLGGKYPYKQLLKEADIPDPLTGDTLKNITDKVLPILDKFNLAEIDK